MSFQPHDNPQDDSSLAVDERIHELELKLEQSIAKLKELMEGTVQSLANVTEMNDPYTAEHQARVSWLSGAIARELGMKDDEIEGCRLAGGIHDIGKINVPGEILNKPGPLTEHETAIIRHHPQAGHDILEPLTFPWSIADVALQHHERMDGSGHPYGISGKDIAYESRIVAVADVVEAMLSHRPYRPAYRLHEALREIREGCGSRYDSIVVEACLRVFNRSALMMD